MSRMAIRQAKKIGVACCTSCIFFCVGCGGNNSDVSSGARSESEFITSWKRFVSTCQDNKGRREIVDYCDRNKIELDVQIVRDDLVKTNSIISPYRGELVVRSKFTSGWTANKVEYEHTLSFDQKDGKWYLTQGKQRNITYNKNIDIDANSLRVAQENGNEVGILRFLFQ
jgi:hypothetical protein